MEGGYSHYLDVNAYTKEEYREAFVGLVQDTYMADIEHILLGEDEAAHYGLTIDMVELINYNAQLGSLLIRYPLKLLPIFNDAIRDVQSSAFTDHALRHQLTYKHNVHARIGNLPGLEVTKVRLPTSQDVGRLLALKATVTRTGPVKMLEYKREFVCTKCKSSFFVESDFEQQNVLPKPTVCQGDDEGVPCHGTKFRDMVAENGGTPQYCSDYQDVKIQEQVQRLAMGTIPRSMNIVLEHDLADTVKAGDDVTIAGVLMRRWKNLIPGEPCTIELVLKVNHITINNEEKSFLNVTEEIREEFDAFWRDHADRPLAGRDEILWSFCPQVFGLYVVKLAVMMVLIGGVQRIEDSGLRIRGESHLLMVGDPGTGKSQFLKYSAKLIPRSVLTTGVGTTSAGLTVTAVKDGGEWGLEAGALVLADGGLCCIDEFASVREHDRATIHEAMEQQTLSVAKAGLVCKLNTRATVLAATNPKGRKEAQWNLDRLKAYIAVCKSLQPRLTPSSEKILTKYYQVRLAEAHARLMYRERVEVQDAVVAVLIMETSMQGAALMGEPNALHSTFPDDPDQQYIMQEAMVLERLGFEDMIPALQPPNRPQPPSPPAFRPNTQAPPIVMSQPPQNNPPSQIRNTDTLDPAIQKSPYFRSTPLPNVFGLSQAREENDSFQHTQDSASADPPRVFIGSSPNSEANQFASSAPSQKLPPRLPSANPPSTATSGRVSGFACQPRPEPNKPPTSGVAGANNSAREPPKDKQQQHTSIPGSEVSGGRNTIGGVGGKSDSRGKENTIPDIFSGENMNMFGSEDEEEVLSWDPTPGYAQPSAYGERKRTGANQTAQGVEKRPRNG